MTKEITMSTRAIKWTCTADPNWEWASDASGHTQFPVSELDQISGSIMLPPMPDYWYPCIKLILQGTGYGHVMLEYSLRNGVGGVRARVLSAEGNWDNTGHWGQTSATTSNGGVNLVASLT
jgi:hypothetical protein